MSFFLCVYFFCLSWMGEFDVFIDILWELYLQYNSVIFFENFDVLLLCEIYFDDGVLEEKLIVVCCGGYCFEQNGLLECVLCEIGFNVCSLLGCVVLVNLLQMLLCIYCLLLVEVVGECWIVDVGFGGQMLIVLIKLLVDILQ